VTLRLKAPHTLILGPSVFEVPNICSTDIRGIPLRFRLADVDEWKCCDDRSIRSISSGPNADLHILTSAGPASDSAGLKAAMVGLVPTIHDGGQM
jgi:hypothetical protein